MPYGTTQQARLLRTLQAAGVTDDAAWGAHLQAVHGTGDHTVISHWRAGRRSMPAEALLDALDLFDPRAVLQPIANRHGLRVDPLAHHAPEGGSVVRDVLGMSHAVGEVAELVEAATDPDSPGGSEWTDGETADTLEAIADARAKLDRMEARVRGQGKGPRVVRGGSR